MTLAIVCILVILVIFGPQVWCGHILKRYSENSHLIPGTGGELATHLLKRLNIPDVKVETTETGQDHYDPVSKTVCLGRNNFEGRSLTAIAVSAHEVGHAIQDYHNFRPLVLRTRLARIIFVSEKVASAILVSFPFLVLLTKSHWAGIAIFLSGLAIMLLPLIMNLITLPVEWDASFGRALPILTAGQYLPENSIPIARKILTAAALTYVAGSLASLLNFYRWIAILRR